jgi:hypothetical protein
MKLVSTLLLAVAGAALLTGCSDAVQPQAPEIPEAQMAISPKACWGQATKVFAQMGQMGQHASEQPNPRLGLANLARALYDAGVIPEPTMQALGQFVAAELGLSIDACT